MATDDDEAGNLGKLRILAPEDAFAGLIGHSRLIQNTISRLRKYAKSDDSVLLQGESGTGKEVAAHGLPENGSRANAPFVTVSCADVTDALLDDLLFGHVRGAYTGAERSVAGAFEEANRGTLFLDEAGQLSPALQAKLLRAVETKVVQRLGSSQPLTVDVRIISATNQDIRPGTGQLIFRADLYYRLAVLRVEMPALRDHLEDIPDLIQYLLPALVRASRREALTVGPEARRLLQEYDYPGNVRELQNILKRAVLLEETSQIRAETIAEALEQAQAKMANLAVEATPALQIEAVPQYYYDTIRTVVVNALTNNSGNIARTAREMKVKRWKVRWLMKKCGLNRDQFK